MGQYEGRDWVEGRVGSDRGEGRGWSRGRRGTGGRGRAGWRQGRKRSGAGFKMVTNRRDRGPVPCVFGWRRLRQGIQSAVATPARRKVHVDPMHVELKDGTERVLMVVRLLNKWDGSECLVSGFFEAATRKCRIPKLNLVISPKAPNGGYFGTMVRRGYRS